MNPSTPAADKPEYERFGKMDSTRAPLAERFARQILDTSAPFLSGPPEHLDVLDIGCGYGHTALALARHCRSVTGIEPSPGLFHDAQANLRASGLPNVVFRHQNLYDLTDTACYDLAVMDSVFEHVPDQAGALRILSNSLRPGGAAFLLFPNKLWPIEPHYFLPFLSYLPLRVANVYLRMSGRGRDYTDASYVPTYWHVRRLFKARPELTYQLVLPAHREGTMGGTSAHYRLGMAALGRFPFLWAISKSFLVIAVKNGR